MKRASPSAAAAAARRWLVGSLCFGICLVLLSPFFWAIYRVMVFGTMPRDDYAPFLLWLLGQKGGAPPESPYAYRILSMVAAVPFFRGLPLLRFSKLPASLSAEYIRATAALAALAYTATVGAAFLAWRLARHCRLPPGEAMLAGALLFVLCWYSQIYGIDPLAILGVVALLSVLDRRHWFTIGIFISIIVNEKICMVLVLWLAIRWLLCGRDRARFRPALLSSLAALGAYLLMVLLVHVPGHSYQLRPTDYISTILANLSVQLSARGVMLNLVPTLVCACVAVVGWPAIRQNDIFDRVDILIIPTLVVLALTVTHKFQIGRVVMHAAPIFVVPAAAAAGIWRERAARFIAGRGGVDRHPGETGSVDPISIVPKPHTPA